VRTIITGAASGIGKAVAHKLSARGDARLLLVDRDGDALHAAAVELEGLARIDTMLADLSDPTTPEAIVAQCVRLFDGVDGIVSNAGSIEGALLSDLTTDQFDRLFAINTRPTWLLGKAARPHLAKVAGSIVATASMAAEHPAPPLGAYSASKAALVMLIRQMAMEWGADGIRCNCVSPGPTVTPMNPAYADPERRNQRAAAIPLRKLGVADDVANAIVFLLGADAGHITAQNLVVDGGMSHSVMIQSTLGSGQPLSG
jgi:NAD(P)-dependent dehydrogenase (short-subunit alcohol dehydrogenase family)